MFDHFAEHLRETNVIIRVECEPYAADDASPIRIVVTDSGGSEKAVLVFTPTRALDAAHAIGQLLAQFLPRHQSRRLAQALRVAAWRVLATRN